MTYNCARSSGGAPWCKKRFDKEEQVGVVGGVTPLIKHLQNYFLKWDIDKNLAEIASNMKFSDREAAADTHLQQADLSLRSHHLGCCILIQTPRPRQSSWSRPKIPDQRSNSLSLHEVRFLFKFPVATVATIFPRIKSFQYVFGSASN